MSGGGSTKQHKEPRMVMFMFMETISQHTLFSILLVFFVQFSDKVRVRAAFKPFITCTDYIHIHNTDTLYKSNSQSCW